jgi:hypothetical protein
MEHNPYQTPTANIENFSPAEAANAELIRKAHINHESSVRSIGLLYYIMGGIASLGIGAAIVIPMVENDSFNGVGIFTALTGAFVVALLALYLWTGRGLRTLKPSARIVAGILAALGLLSFPIGTLINGYFLYLLFSEKGKTVFSDDYQNVIDATPHIKAGTSVLVWLLLAIMIIGVVAAVVIPMMNK